MHVYVGSHYAGHVTVAPEDYKDYSFHVSISEPGVSRVLISYWNAATGEGRPLYVKEINIAHALNGRVQAARFHARELTQGEDSLQNGFPHLPPIGM